MCSSEQYAIIGYFLLVFCRSSLLVYPVIFGNFKIFLTCLLILFSSIFGLNSLMTTSSYKIVKASGLNKGGSSSDKVSKAQV